MKTKRVEQSEMPFGKGVTSFPTMMIEDEDGSEEKRIEGRRQTGKEILADLGISLRKRPHTLRRRRHVGGRKLTHRTLRNYVALR